VYGKRQQHRDFAEAWDAAEMTFVDMLASIEAKRATIGETVERRTTRVETDRKGNVVATIETTETRTRLSDSCLIHLLDRRHPEYRAAAQGRELARPGGKPMTVVTIPADASDIEAADAYLKLLRQR
jgi:hypothetical protein